MVMKRRHVYFIGLSVWSLAGSWMFTWYNSRVSTVADHQPKRWMNVTEVIGWEQYRSRNASDYIFPDRITTLVNSRKTCTATYPPLVLVIISSSANHFARRTAIRKTWAHSIDEKFNISVAFLVGVLKNGAIDNRLKDESNELGDIIIEDFIDSYHNLTLKSLMMLKWVKNNCKNVPYLLRLDDDVYMNTKNLAAFVDDVARTDHSRDLFCGYLFCFSKPVRNALSKWYMPLYMYAEEVYPEYLAGFCYIVSTEIALKIYDEAFSIPMIHIEDIFLTGICAARIGAKPSRHYSFRGYNRGKRSMEECTTKDKYLVMHSFDISVKQMYAVHVFISKCSNLSYSNDELLPSTKFSYCPH